MSRLGHSKIRILQRPGNEKKLHEYLNGVDPIVHIQTQIDKMIKEHPVPVRCCDDHRCELHGPQTYKDVRNRKSKPNKGYDFDDMVKANKKRKLDTFKDENFEDKEEVFPKKRTYENGRTVEVLSAVTFDPEFRQGYVYVDYSLLAKVIAQKLEETILDVLPNSK
jgi:hypothetical protein